MLSRARYVEQGETIHSRKSYWQKLGVVDKKRRNRVTPSKGLTYPAVVYGGFIAEARSMADQPRKPAPGKKPWHLLANLSNRSR